VPAQFSALSKTSLLPQRDAHVHAHEVPPAKRRKTDILSDGRLSGSRRNHTPINRFWPQQNFSALGRLQTLRVTIGLTHNWIVLSKSIGAAWLVSLNRGPAGDGYFILLERPILSSFSISCARLIGQLFPVSLI
jgi:hypothetical protein